MSYAWRRVQPCTPRRLERMEIVRTMTQHDARDDHKPAPARQRAGQPTPPDKPARARPGRPARPPSAPTRPSAPKRPDRREQRSISLSQGTLEYTLRLSGRARRVRLVIQPGGALEVVAPHGAASARIETALREH